MNLDAPIKEIMHTGFLTISPNEYLSKAEKMIFTSKLKHLPVIKNGKLVGLITRTDIKRMSFANTFDEAEADIDTTIFQMLKVGQVMTDKPFTMPSHSTIREVAEVLSQKEFRTIPIVDGDNLVGLVSTKDIIKYFVENA
jgi:CBS domain-containing membrane protein